MYSERLKRLEEVVAPQNDYSTQKTDVRTSDSGNESALQEEHSRMISPGYQFAGLGIGFVSMIGEVVLSHPFVVIRNQCQVRGNSAALHLLPFSLILIVSKCIRNQGTTFLWKGLGSVFVVRGLCFISENVISEITSLPKEVSRLSSLRRMGANVLLRTLSWIVVTPFYAASVVEIVQSVKASEPTNLISCLREGFYRLFHLPTAPRFASTGPMFRGDTVIRNRTLSTSRLLPLWRLIPPVVCFNVGHYVIRSIACTLATSYWGGDEDRLEQDAELNRTLKTGGMDYPRFHSPSETSTEARDMPSSDLLALAYQRQETAIQSIYLRYYTDLLAAMTANLVADVISYPLETLVIRLCVQGTRTLVDNMDTGDVVVPVVSAYDGLFDAARMATDGPVGVLGLYRGFGALIAQYALQAAFLCGIRHLYQQLLYFWPPTLSTESKFDVAQHQHIPRVPPQAIGDVNTGEHL